MGPNSALAVLNQRIIEISANQDVPRIPLGPLDRLALKWLPISVVFSYPGSVDIDILEEALRHTLGHYPALTGRLAYTRDGNPCIEQSDSTVSFVVAECSEELTSFLGDTSSLELFPDSGLSLCPALGQYLFALQLTRFETGFTLAIRISHIVTDADGLTQFGLDLSHSYRRLSTGILPTLKPSFLEPHVPATTSHLVDHVPKMYTLDPPQHGPRSSAVTTKVIRMPKPFLTSLKELAQPQEGWVSTFDALSAHLYQTIHRARISTGVVPLSPTDYFTAVNVRSRLNLPDRYFPMGTLDPYFTFDTDMLHDAPLSEIAIIMHNITSSFSPKETQDTVEWLLDNSMSHHRFRFGNGCFMTTKWSGFNLYDIDIGASPLRVSLPVEKDSTVDGLAYLVPTEIEGAIDVYLSLDDTVWEVLKGGKQLCELPSDLGKQ